MVVGTISVSGTTAGIEAGTVGNEDVRLGGGDIRIKLVLIYVKENLFEFGQFVNPQIF
jgi:hypothetical protein